MEGPTGIWQISLPYSNQGEGQIKPLKILSAPRIKKAIYTSDLNIEQLKNRIR